MHFNTFELYKLSYKAPFHCTNLICQFILSVVPLVCVCITKLWKIKLVGIFLSRGFCLKQNLQGANPDTTCRVISFRKQANFHLHLPQVLMRECGQQYIHKMERVGCRLSLNNLQSALSETDTGLLAYQKLFLIPLQSGNLGTKIVTQSVTLKITDLKDSYQNVILRSQQTPSLNTSFYYFYQQLHCHCISHFFESHCYLYICEKFFCMHRFFFVYF